MHLVAMEPGSVAEFLVRTVPSLSTEGNGHEETPSFKRGAFYADL